MLASKSDYIMLASFSLCCCK